ncbi:hypothetical protein [Psychroserpens jangbogonensis]|uniref:hypothetical protein n=1 Tax=Psychroserpens jangbogonensis TaxID=1484460 RepID=UPI00053E8649|nr:hypothetical protein [Psychroserpens jangbogonensis]
MELYKWIIEIVDANLIYCLIPIILTLILVELFFKNRFETKRALNIICWIILLYTIVSIIYSLIGLIFFPEKFSFIDRATGPYKTTYWMMFFSSAILPFTLFIKKLSKKFLYVLIVAFLMKIGFFFERFVIIVTSFHRDYSPVNNNLVWSDSFTFGLSMIFLQGFIIGILILGIFEISKRKTTV